MRRLILLAICLLFIGLFVAGCGEQTAANITELGDYARGMVLDGSDVHSFAR